MKPFFITTLLLALTLLALLPVACHYSPAGKGSGQTVSFNQ